MAKAPQKDLDVTRLVMGRLAAMPHKPHVSKEKVKKTSAKKPKKAK